MGFVAVVLVAIVLLSDVSLALALALVLGVIWAAAVLIGVTALRTLVGGLSAGTRWVFGGFVMYF